jgi:mono/diheme cytochrome c family protein
MRGWRLFLILGVLAIVAVGAYGLRTIWGGFSTASDPSYLERVAARTARNLSIPRNARLEINPFQPTPDNLKEGRESFIARCAVCHGPDGIGKTEVGRNLYPKVPDLQVPETQKLSDGEIRYIIRNGVRLTGMPGWARPHDEQSDDSWKLVLFIRGLRELTSNELRHQETTHGSAHFVGSQSCKSCHAQI